MNTLKRYQKVQLDLVYSEKWDVRNTCHLHQLPHQWANSWFLIRACWLLFEVPELLWQQIGHMAKLGCDYLLVVNRGEKCVRFSLLTETQFVLCHTNIDLSSFTAPLPCYSSVCRFRKAMTEHIFSFHVQSFLKIANCFCKSHTVWWAQNHTTVYH